MDYFFVVFIKIIRPCWITNLSMMSLSLQVSCRSRLAKSFKEANNYKRVAPLTFFGPLKQKSGPFNVLDRGHLNSPDC